jgi:hypothetical protein
MGFKILKQEAKDPEYSDYIKRRIDIAAAEGVVFDLADEDEARRIDALHKDPNLYHEKKLTTLDRVRIGNKEYLVAGVEYDFYNINTNIYADKYIDYVGKTLKPIKTQDPRTNEVSVNQQGMYVYDIEFSPEKVDSIISEFSNIDPVEFRFYPGTNSVTRTAQPVEVKRKEFFKYATWEELFIGKEKRYTSSTLNKLSTLRKEVDYEERQQFNVNNTDDEKQHQTNNIDKPVVNNIEPNIEKDEEVVVSTKNGTSNKKQSNTAGK